MEVEENKELKEYIKKGRWLAWMSYLGLLMIIPAVAQKDNPFTVYHVKQGLVLAMFSIFVDFTFLMLPQLGRSIAGIVTVVNLFFIFYGIINAIKGDMKPLPLIGKIAENLNL